MRLVLPVPIIAVLAVVMHSNVADAAIFYDTDVTHGVIFGSGNANGSFTIVRDNGVELGLRAKQRYPNSQNIFNSNEDGTYSFGTIDRLDNRASWNLEWTIDTNFDGSTEWNLSDLTYLLTIDFVPTFGGTPLSNSYDPLREVNPQDTALGKSGEVGNRNNIDQSSENAYATFQLYLEDFHIAQESTNVGFGGVLDGSNGILDGIYTISLNAFEGPNNLIATNSIQVYVGDVAPEPVPEPASVVLLGMGAVGLAYGAARRRRQPTNADA